LVPCGVDLWRYPCGRRVRSGVRVCGSRYVLWLPGCTCLRVRSTSCCLFRRTVVRRVAATSVPSVRLVCGGIVQFLVLFLLCVPCDGIVGGGRCESLLLPLVLSGRPVRCLVG